MKQFNPVVFDESTKTDALDTPDCFGEFNKENKLCAQYCGVSIKCCVIHNKYPKVDIIEQLLTQNQYAVKLQ